MVKVGKISLFDWFPFQKWRIVCSVEAADEIPEKIPLNGSVLVADHNHQKWLAFDCPCRSGHRIMLNLDKKHRPFWRISNERSLSIHPSVDFETKDRRCHYYIKNGKIMWAHKR